MQSKKLKISKSVQPGMMIRVRAGKIVRCGKNQKPMGVYQAETIQKIVLLNGKEAHIEHPSGMVFYGHAKVMIKGV